MSTGLPRPGLARSAHRGQIKLLRGYVSKSSDALNTLMITQLHVASLREVVLAQIADRVAWPSPSISGARCACVIMVHGPIRYGMQYSATRQFVSGSTTALHLLRRGFLHFSAFHLHGFLRVQLLEKYIYNYIYIRTYIYVHVVDCLISGQFS